MSDRRTVTWAGALTVAVVVGAILVSGVIAGLALMARVEARPAPSAIARPGYAGRIQDPVPVPTAAPAGSPVRIDIPELGIESGLEGLGTDATGKLRPPDRPGEAGWYAAGVIPGQVGPAIIAGHVDYSAGPGIFERLDELAPGDTVDVTMSTGRSLTFRVDRTSESRKVAFPTSDVYGTPPDPQLRLITCAGDFDRRTARYLDNLVVFATLQP